MFNTVIHSPILTTPLIASYRLFLLSLLTCCVFFFPFPAWADTRGDKIEEKTPAQYVAETQGKSLAVIIGIDDYQHLGRLSYAVEDAKAMAGTLARQGFKVTSLYNTQANRQAILRELQRDLVTRVHKEDRVLIFFAGHIGETTTPGERQAMGYMMPVDAKPDLFADTAIPIELLQEISETIPAKHVLFLIDICYGSIGGRRLHSLPPMTKDYLQVMTREPARQLITAGGTGQQSLAGPKWKHSVFTYYLLEGLRKGYADLNGDGIIPASELFAFLDEHVQSAALAHNHVQRPEMWGLTSDKGEFIFIPQATPFRPQVAQSPNAKGKKSAPGTGTIETIVGLLRNIGNPLNVFTKKTPSVTKDKIENPRVQAGDAEALEAQREKFELLQAQQILKEQEQRGKNLEAQLAEARRMAAEEDQRRVAAEQARQEHETLLAQQQAELKAEQARLAAEAEQRRVAAEQARQEHETLLAQQQAALKVEQARLAAEEEQRQQALAQLAEAQRVAVEQARREHEALLAQQQAELKAEQARLAAEEEQRQQALAQLAEAQRRAAEEEQRRVAAEQARQEQEALLAQQQAALKAEQARLATEEEQRQQALAQLAEAQRAQLAEAQRVAAEAKEQQRLAAEAQRVAAEQAEQARLAAEKEQRARALAQQELTRQAQRAEAQRVAAEEEQRARALAQQELTRQAQRAEAQRVAAEEEQRARALAQQELTRKAQQAEAQRVAAEQARREREAALQVERARRAAEEEQRKQLEEARRLAALEEERQRVAAEQARREREAALQAEQARQAAEEKQRKQLEEARRLAALEEERQRVARQKQEAALQAEQARQAAEEEQRKQVEEARRLAALEEERRRVEAEQARRAAEEEQRKQVEEARRLAALEEERQRVAAEQANGGKGTKMGEQQAVPMGEQNESGLLGFLKNMFQEKKPASKSEETGAVSRTDPTDHPMPPSDQPEEPQPEPVLEARLRSQNLPNAFSAQVKGKDGAPMVLIPAGKFKMGSTPEDISSFLKDFDGVSFDAFQAEIPQRQVVLDAYYIDQYEVSYGLYRRFIEETDRPAPKLWGDKRFHQSDQPVLGITWHDANAYCQWAGKRLPTEAEWEKAARGPEGLFFPWGNSWDPNRTNTASYWAGQSFASIATWAKWMETALERRKAGPLEIGTLASGKSPYGVHDMAGNVSEWVFDWYMPYNGQPTLTHNPKGADFGTMKVHRGGSWSVSAIFARTAYRARENPDKGSPYIGMRCAKSPE